MERRWHLWEAMEQFARRRCAAASSDVGISILLVLFTVFFLAGATIAVVFAARPFPRTTASSAELDMVDVGQQPARRPTAARPLRQRPQEDADASPATDAIGLRLSRAPDVLREQFGLGRGAGLVVEAVAVDSFGSRAGFKRNDVLVSLDDQLLVLPAQVPALFEAADGETPCRCRLLRGGRPLTISLSTRPTAVLTSAVAPTDAEPDQDTPTQPRETSAARKDPAVTNAAPPAKPPAAVSRTPVKEAPKLRIAASVVPPAAAAKPATDSKPARPPKTGLLMRVAEDTLLQQDSDYQIKVVGGSEKRLVVRDARGRIIFNDAIETPEQRTLMPLAVRERVERMERLLAPPTDASRDEPVIVAAEAVVRGPDPARVEWRLPGTAATGDRSDHVPDGTEEPAIEIGRLDIDPVEIR